MFRARRRRRAQCHELSRSHAAERAASMQILVAAAELSGPRAAPPGLRSQACTMCEPPSAKAEEIVSGRIRRVGRSMNMHKLHRR